MEWYLSDHLGSTTLLVNESGLEVERTEYFPYGEVQSGGLEKYGFTGQENDADTGLMYYGARYYSPGYRIFVQPDTMLPDPYNPQALNRYAYALNNPVRYTDPSGHNPLLVIAVAGVACAVISLGAQVIGTGSFSEVDYGEVAIAGVVGLVGSAAAITIMAGGGSCFAGLGIKGTAATLTLGGIAGGVSGQASIVSRNIATGENPTKDTVFDGNSGQFAADTGFGIITEGRGPILKEVGKVSNRYLPQTNSNLKKLYETTSQKLKGNKYIYSLSQSKEIDESAESFFDQLSDYVVRHTPNSLMEWFGSESQNEEQEEDNN